MKIKNIYIALLAVATVALPACESDVLDLTPITSFTSDVVYESADRCELAVIGAYAAAQTSNYDGSYSRGYPFGAASIFQGEMRGEDMCNTQAFYQYTYESMVNTTSTFNNIAMWEATFETVNICNVVLKGVTEAHANGVINDATFNQYKGEMLFLRAMCYHYMMLYFALPYNMTGNNDYGLPIYTEPSDSKDGLNANMEIGRSTVKETYAFILDNLNEAENLLPQKHPVNSVTRATSGAAVAMKTRVYLHMRDWNNVITEAKKLVSDADPAQGKTVYALTPSCDTPFSTAQSDNPESIFSVENSSTDHGSVNGAMYSMMISRWLVCTSPILYNSTWWLEDDTRRTKLLYDVYEGEGAADDVYFYSCYKYPDETMGDNAPIIRYAEVLLNYAEAAARGGDTTTGLALLNAVRNRSLADPATQGYTDFASAKDLVEAILWERRIEFQGEGRRWEDLHRLAQDDLFPANGIPAKFNGAALYADFPGAYKFGDMDIVNDPSNYITRAYDVSNRNFLWPIPQRVLTRNATLAQQQNQGW